jgi:putative DNA primase/helicase
MQDKINIAVGLSAESSVWRNKSVSWDNLVNKLSKPIITNETHKEYINASKDQQSTIKDVGGFVGATLLNNRRTKSNVVSRQIVSLDIDFGELDFWNNFTMLYSCAAVLHSTHKHSSANPRFRLVIALDREVSPDEYSAISRGIAGSLDIEIFDPTTFDTNRLMFWPSVSKDGEFIFEKQKGEYLSADSILEDYDDWKDTSLWPISAKHSSNINALKNKQQDPLDKKGVIGAFCRSYDIHEAVAEFIPDEYVKTDEDRYTYSKGSTSNGVIVYDDKFMFSHHGSDPISGLLCNAFDLVRIHKFGLLDAKQQVIGKSSNSFKAMEDFARELSKIKKQIAEESVNAAKYDFSEDAEEAEEASIDWMEELEIDAKGKYLSTAPNISTIFSHDSRLKDAFKYNDFNYKNYAMHNLPWRKLKEPEPMKNVDFSGIRNYIESIYGISSTLKVEDALMIQLEKNRYNPVEDYLNSLDWDGTKRLDSILIDYMGADDTLFNREAARKTLVAAVARIYRPGIKFDLVLTLVGGQASGKSSLISILGNGWSSDTFTTVSGKESFEQLQGAWLIEIAELSGFRKGDVESVKHFISKQEDSFRPAYGRVIETFPRRCVFIGTTNDANFLKDPTGNRRFLPVDVFRSRAKRNLLTELKPEVDQIWAEAVKLFKTGEPLTLSSEAEYQAVKEQAAHSDVDERRGIIEQYLDIKVPAHWGSLSIEERRLYLSGDKFSGSVRSYVSVPEVWCECLCLSRESMDRYKTRPINDILKSLTDWEQVKSTKTFPIYGKQKYYERCL